MLKVLLEAVGIAAAAARKDQIIEFDLNIFPSYSNSFPLLTRKYVAVFRNFPCWEATLLLLRSEIKLAQFKHWYATDTVILTTVRNFGPWD